MYGYCYTMMISDSTDVLSPSPLQRDIVAMATVVREGAGMDALR